MDEDRIDTLFKPYEKGEGGRFGLGLSIVSKVVKANHYQVRGENTADGVIFRIFKERPRRPKPERRTKGKNKRDSRQEHKGETMAENNKSNE